MKNLLIFMVLLISSILFDLMLDLPLGVPMREDLRVIFKRLVVIDPVISWGCIIILVFILIRLGFYKSTDDRSMKNDPKDH